MLSLRLRPFRATLLLILLSFGLPATAFAGGAVPLVMSCSPSCTALTQSTITLTATVDPGDTAPTRYVWDLDGNGTYETVVDTKFSRTDSQTLSLAKPGTFTVSAKAQSGAEPNFVDITTGSVLVVFSDPPAEAGADTSKVDSKRPQDGVKVDPKLDDTRGKIAAMKYDLGQDGNFEFILDPKQEFVLPPAKEDRTVTVVGVDAGGAVVDSTVITIPATAPISGCNPFGNVGYIRIAGGCATLSDGGRRLTVRGNRLWMLGLPFRLEAPRGQSQGAIIFDARTGKMTTSGDLVITLQGTPVAPEVVLWRGSLNDSNGWSIPGLAGFISRMPRTAPATAVTLASFSAGQGCVRSESRFCARVPGDIQVTGDIGIRVSAERGLYADGFMSLGGGALGLLRLSMRVDPDAGLVIDELRGRALLLPLDVANTPTDLTDDYIVSNANISYEPLPADTWRLSGTVSLPVTNRPTLTADATIVRGEIETASLRLGRDPIPWGESLTITALNATARGRSASGSMGATFNNRANGIGIVGSLAFVIDWSRMPAIITANGNATINAQGQNVAAQLSGARFAVNSDGSTRFGANISANIDVSDVPFIAGDSLPMSGVVNGWVSPGVGSGPVRYLAEGTVGMAGLTQAFYRKTEQGAHVCALSIVSFRIAFDAANNYQDWFFGCNIGTIATPSSIPSFRSKGVHSLAKNTIAVPRGLVALTGKFTVAADAAAEIRGPGGQRIAVPAAGPKGTAPVAVGNVTLSRSGAGEVAFFITKPAKGTWTFPAAARNLKVGADAGEKPPTVKVRVADSLHATATVGQAGTGKDLVSWELREVIGTDTRVVGAGSGPKTVSFTPGVGAKRRTLVIIRTANGIPFGDSRKVTFKVKSFGRKAPTMLQLSRAKGGRTSARWNASLGAVEWVVSAADKRGNKRFAIVSKPTWTTDLTGTVTVTVRSRTATGTYSAPAKLTLRAK